MGVIARCDRLWFRFGTAGCRFGKGLRPRRNWSDSQLGRPKAAPTVGLSKIRCCSDPDYLRDNLRAPMLSQMRGREQEKNGWAAGGRFQSGTGDSCSLRQHFPPVTADFIVPTFTKNVKVGQPPAFCFYLRSLAAHSDSISTIPKQGRAKISSVSGCGRV